MLQVATGKNCRIIKIKGISTVSLSFLISYLMNPGEVNQISSFRSKNLPSNQRPEADDDESSPVSGVCPHLYRHWGVCLHLLLYVRMTSCHFRLAGGPLSVMIYWFSSLLLWLDFLFCSSLLLFSAHHRLERRWGEQLQPAKRRKKQPQRDPETERNVDGKEEFHIDHPLNCQFLFEEEEPLEQSSSNFPLKLLCDMTCD